MLKASLRVHQALLQGSTKDDVASFNGYLGLFMNNIENLENLDINTKTIASGVAPDRDSKKIKGI